MSDRLSGRLSDRRSAKRCTLAAVALAILLHLPAAHAEDGAEQAQELWVCELMECAAFFAIVGEAYEIRGDGAKAESSRDASMALLAYSSVVLGEDSNMIEKRFRSALADKIEAVNSGRMSLSDYARRVLPACRSLATDPDVRLEELAEQPTSDVCQ